MEFSRKNFSGLHACTYCVDRAFKQSRRKLSLKSTVLQSKSVDFYHNINFAVYSYILACVKSKFDTLLG